LVIYEIKSKGVPRQAEVAQGVPGRLRPQIFLTSRHYKGGRLSAKCTGHLYPRRNHWYSLSEAESTSGHVVIYEICGGIILTNWSAHPTNTDVTVLKPTYKRYCK